MVEINIGKMKLLSNEIIISENVYRIMSGFPRAQALNKTALSGSLICWKLEYYDHDFYVHEGRNRKDDHYRADGKLSDAVL